MLMVETLEKAQGHRQDNSHPRARAPLGVLVSVSPRTPPSPRWRGSSHPPSAFSVHACDFRVRHPALSMSYPVCFFHLMFYSSRFPVASGSSLTEETIFPPLNGLGTLDKNQPHMDVRVYFRALRSLPRMLTLSCARAFH